jgi:hypothetical protein
VPDPAKAFKGFERLQTTAYNKGWLLITLIVLGFLLIICLYTAPLPTLIVLIIIGTVAYYLHERLD